MLPGGSGGGPGQVREEAPRKGQPPSRRKQAGNQAHESGSASSRACLHAHDVAEVQPRCSRSAYRGIAEMDESAKRATRRVRGVARRSVRQRRGPRVQPAPLRRCLAEEGHLREGSKHGPGEVSEEASPSRGKREASTEQSRRKPKEVEGSASSAAIWERTCSAHCGASCARVRATRSRQSRTRPPPGCTCSQLGA